MLYHVQTSGGFPLFVNTSHTCCFKFLRIAAWFRCDPSNSTVGMKVMRGRRAAVYNLKIIKKSEN